MKRLIACAVVCLCVIVAGCSMTSKASTFNGVTDFDGDEVVHLNTTSVAVHLLFKDPLWGDATLDRVVSDLTGAAKAEGAGSVRIVQSDTTTLWWVLPPISFVVHPVIANAAADTK